MSTAKERSVTYGLFLLSALCFTGFYQLSEAYDGYRIIYGLGLIRISREELVFYLWYALFGSAALLSLAAALSRTGLPQAAESLVRGAFARPRLFLLGGTLVLASAVLCFRLLVLRGAPVADDESTYVFIARTLLQARVVNPLPEDHGFFRNQFIVLNQAGWFGKYPVGHPALLAVGEAVGLRFLVPAAVTALVFLLTYAVGKRLFGRLEALLGLCLLLVSPQFVFTGATELSQPSSCLCMMLGLLAMLRIAETGLYRWYLVAGAAWGYGMLVRPLPGALFLAAAMAVYLFQEPWSKWRTRPAPRAARILVASLPLALCGALFLWVNRQQTGEALQTGYHAAHGGLELFVIDAAKVWFSLAGAFLRQNFWLFGWPVSFIFVFLARGRVSLALFWSLIAAEYAYRFIVPKTVVSTTGPVYVAEIVPLLALATASGAIRAKRWLQEVGVERSNARVSALLIASTLVAALMFLPVQVRWIDTSSRAWLTPYRLLEKRGERRALVFTRLMVPPETGLSWAYHPPNPSPTLEDDIIFVRSVRGADGLRPMVEFWRKRFPDRTAWIYGFSEGEPALIQIEKSRTDRGDYYHLDSGKAAPR